MSTLTDSEFLDLAALAFEHLDRAIEQIAEAADIDLEINRDGGLLEIEFADSSKIVINNQIARHEIWVAAKVGGFHFFYDSDTQRWINTRNGQELYSVVAFLISQQSGVSFL